MRRFIIAKLADVLELDELDSTIFGYEKVANADTYNFSPYSFVCGKVV